MHSGTYEKVRDSEKQCIAVISRTAVKYISSIAYYEAHFALCEATCSNYG